MAFCELCNRDHNVGFISTRFAGTDGVSLETAKWAEVFEKKGFSCYYFAGELDRPENQCYLVPEAHFTHPDIKEINQNVFGVHERGRFVTQKIHEVKEILKDHLYEFIDKFNIELLVPENALTIPMNIPLGIALTEVLSENRIPVIAHHHDFFWERQRFLTNAIWDYLNMAFPPHLPNIQHVVINSSADNQVSLRTGISPTVIPNVMDFNNPPKPADEYVADVRKDLGVTDDDLFILQPTRVVQRKGIEHAIELINRIGRKAKFVISHASGDEGMQYQKRVMEYANLLKVDIILASDIIGEHRGKTSDGRKIYTLHDIYPHADLVTFCSSFEGFGNALLEAIYFKKPIVVNKYSIYSIDIQPKGFSMIEIDGYVTEEAVKSVKKVLDNVKLKNKIIEHNYDIATKYFSYTILYNELFNLISKCTGCPYWPDIQI